MRGDSSLTLRDEVGREGTEAQGRATHDGDQDKRNQVNRLRMWEDKPSLQRELRSLSGSELKKPFGGLTVLGGKGGHARDLSGGCSCRCSLISGAGIARRGGAREQTPYGCVGVGGNQVWWKLCSRTVVTKRRRKQGARERRKEDDEAIEG